MKRILTAMLLALCCISASAQLLDVIPSPVYRAFDSNGKPLIGGKLFSYLAGTSTPFPTYADASGVSANSNPVILDSTGQAKIFLGGATYKLVLQNSAGVVQWTVDNIVGGGRIVSNPSGTQTVLQLDVNHPFSVNYFLITGSGSAASFNGKLNASLFPGSTTSSQVLAAQATCASTGCIIGIPPGSNAGTLPPLANMLPGSLIVDERYVNSAGPFNNSFPGTHAWQEWTQTVGPLQSWETGSNVYTGPMMLSLTENVLPSAVPTIPTQGETIPIFVGIRRQAGSNRIVQGEDINIGCEGLEAECVGFEVDMNNGAAVDDTALKTVGIRLIGGFAHRPGIGLQINSVVAGAGTTRNWMYGAAIANYHQVGINLNSADPQRVADLLIQPPDDLSTSNSINVQNSAGSASVFIVADDGSVFSKPGYTSTNFKNSQGMQIASGTGCLSGTPAVGAACVVTMTLPVAEANTAYHITGCQIMNLSGPQVTLGSAGSLTTTTFTVSEYPLNSVAVATAGQVNCTVTNN